LNTREEPEIESYRRAAASLLGLIRGERAESRTPQDRRRRAKAKVARTAALLSLLGNPQLRYPIVHVTGTSGKGSTAAAIAAILSAAGYRVGLRTSPYVQVMTEKLRIGHALIDAQTFALLVDRVLGVAEAGLPPRPSEPRAGYAETWVAMALLWFAERNVDVAVVEVGAGGRFDSTNVFTPAVSVITSVGLDHVITLGPALADIAWHKAGIVKPGIPVVTGDLPAEADAVVREEALRARSRVVCASPDHRLSMPGAPSFFVANARVAIAAVETLRDSGLVVSAAAIERGLREPMLPARFERMPGADHPPVWIDSAHNPDKIDALVAAWTSATTTGRPPVIVFGAIASKDVSAMFSRLTLDAAAIFATTPHVHGKRSLAAEEIAAALSGAGQARPVIVSPEPGEAIEDAIVLARSLATDVLVTGSLYLAGEIRRSWYPDDDIVWQRTPWPATPEDRVSGTAASLCGAVRDVADDQGDETADHQILPDIDQ
jgi:dihydrofolate synthase/folylpolyglutamate synthase